MGGQSVMRQTMMQTTIRSKLFNSDTIMGECLCISRQPCSENNAMVVVVGRGGGVQ